MDVDVEVDLEMDVDLELDSREVARRDEMTSPGRRSGSR